MGKVISHLDASPATLLVAELCGSTHVGLEELTDEHAARTKRLRRQLQKTAKHVQAVRSPIERQTRFEARNLIGQGRQHGTRDIGRIGHEQVEGTHESLVYARGKVTLHDVNRPRKTQRIAIAHGKAHGKLRDIGCCHVHARPLRGDGATDAAGATANLEHLGTVTCSLGRINAEKRRIHQNLGLWPRNEYSPLAAQYDMAKGHLARHVLQGLSAPTAQHAIVHGSKFLGRKNATEAGVDLDAREAAGIADEPLRREARVFVTLLCKVASRPVEDAFDGPSLLCHEASQ